MALLGFRSTTLAGVLLLAAGCYAPELRDCAVTCASVDDCGPGQVCGNDRFCAAPQLAGTCTTLLEPDAGRDASDAGRDAGRDAAPPADARPDAPPPPPVDAPPPPPDAPLMHRLTVRKEGGSKVDIPGVGTCEDAECTYDVPPGTYTLRAVSNPAWMFETWKDACAGQGDTCVLLVGAPQVATAKFKKSDK